MAIESVQIATNRNAPVGSDAINLYNTDFAQNLTLGQLMSAVCLRAGAFLEAQSIAKINSMNSGTSQIEELSAMMERLSGEEIPDAEWSAMRATLEATYGIPDLPTTINSYANRIAVLNALKEKLEQLTQVSQEDMIDLQTLVNRRDAAYTTSTNLVKSIQNSAMKMAESL